MKWLQLISDLIKSILQFFGASKVEQQQQQVEMEKHHEKIKEEINEKVETASDTELDQLAIDAGLVMQRPDGPSRT